MKTKLIPLRSIIYLLISFSFLISACNKPELEENDSNKKFCIPDSLLKNLSFDTLHSEQGVNELKLAGKISFNEDNLVKIFPLASGHVTDVKVSLGDHVVKGQIIAIVHSQDMAAYFSS